MAGGGGGATGFDAALQRRQALMGASGPRALVKNGKVFLIALFACLGGVLYGYNQGMFAQVLTMNSFIKAVNITPDLQSYGHETLSNMSTRLKVMLQRLVSTKVY